MAFWWRLVLLNRILRRLLPATPWRFPSGWLWLRDEPGSKTLELVYREIMRGDYAIPVSLMPGDVVLDLGAHVGMFSLPLAKGFPFVRFVCVEPDWLNFENLAKNAKGLTNVEIYHAAVGPRGTVAMKQLDKTNTGSNRSEWLSGPGNQAFLAPSMPLRWWVRLAGGQVKVLKMDIEGAEFLDFYPAKDLLGVECVIGEIHRFAGDAEAMVGAIRAAGPTTRLTIHV